MPKGPLGGPRPAVTCHITVECVYDLKDNRLSAVQRHADEIKEVADNTLQDIDIDIVYVEEGHDMENYEDTVAIRYVGTGAFFMTDGHFLYNGTMQHLRNKFSINLSSIQLGEGEPYVMVMCQ